MLSRGVASSGGEWDSGILDPVLPVTNSCQGHPWDWCKCEQMWTPFPSIRGVFSCSSLGAKNSGWQYM